MAAIDSIIKPKKRKHVRTGDIAEKMLATAKYTSELSKNLRGNDQLARAGLKMLAAYFDAYVDNVARSNTYKYHHIYEFNEVGNKNARLFVSTLNDSGKPMLSYSFKQSTKPSSSGYVFSNKAFVMENGIPLRITPKDSEYLVFEYKGDMYSKKSVYVPNPGGTEVEGSFAELFHRFMTTHSQKALQELGFFSSIEKGIANETRYLLPKISSGKIDNMATEAARSVNNIARKMNR